jgi:hypothetical protein
MVNQNGLQVLEKVTGKAAPRQRVVVRQVKRHAEVKGVAREAMPVQAGLMAWVVEGGSARAPTSKSVVEGGTGGVEEDVLITVERWP